MMSVSGPATAQSPDFGQTIRINMGKKKTVDLDWILTHAGEGNLFATTHDDFEKNYDRRTYTWLDKEKSRARFNADRVEVKLRNEEVGETIVSFKDGKISGVMISVVNKGDDGYIKDVPFKKAVKQARDVLASVAKVKENSRKKDETISKADGFVWSSKQALYMLEYLWVPEDTRDGWIFYAHCEFVRIRILPPQAQLGVQQNMVKTNVSRASLAKQVKRDGDKVYLEGVPMVDQGGKGYCAVASFERVMRYYGSQVDMHDLADLANADAFGTSPSGMKDAVHKMAVRVGMNSREPIFMEGRDYDSLLKSYNRESKKAGSGEIKKPDGISGLYREMDPDVCRQMRIKDANFAKFNQEVVKSINAGIPVMWALQLGMFWEDKIEDSYEANRFKDDDDGDSDAKPKIKPGDDEDEEARKGKRPPEYMSGGHMRLIVGYNLKSRKIYYTDSWGPGHEMKSMDIEQAWTATMALFMIEPK